MQFQLKRKGRPKNESWNSLGVRPDPAFYLNSDPDSDSRSQTNAAPDTATLRLCRHLKLNFYMKNILNVGYGLEVIQHTYVP